MGTILVASAVLRVVDLMVLLGRPRLFAAAVRVWARGFLASPYREGGFARLHEARRAGLSRSELTYGETPVVTARRLFKAAGVSSSSTVLDLGAGRGRVLLAARSLGARARGIELLDEQRAPVEDVLASVGAELVGGDLREADLAGVTHVWVTWTCMGEPNRAAVLARLRTSAPGTVVFVVTWPIDDGGFVLEGTTRALFTWGRAEVFRYRRV